MLFPANLSLERKGQHDGVPSSLNQASQWSWGKLTSVRILTFCGLLSVFPGSCVCRLSSEWGVPKSLILVTRHHGGGKNSFSLYALWWVLGWAVFTLGDLIKIILSRLKIFHCSHCNSRLSVAKLNWLFSLKTKFYSPKASHWTQPSSSQTQSDLGPKMVSKSKPVSKKKKWSNKIWKLTTPKLHSQDREGPSQAERKQGAHGAPQASMPGCSLLLGTIRVPFSFFFWCQNCWKSSFEQKLIQIRQHPI